MDWIRVSIHLPDHPKTKRAARMLGISNTLLVGHLLCLWGWSVGFAFDGDLGKYDAFDISEAANWKGDAESFVAALLDCGPGDSAGFLEYGPNGLKIHDWTEYAGPMIEIQKKQKRNRELYADVALTREVKARDGNRCRYCGRAVKWNDRKGPEGATYDHIDPTGPNTEANIVVSCRSCNSAKGKRTPEQAGMRLLPVPKVDNLPESTGQPPEIHRESADVDGHVTDGQVREISSVEAPDDPPPDPAGQGGEARDQAGQAGREPGASETGDQSRPAPEPAPKSDPELVMGHYNKRFTDKWSRPLALTKGRAEKIRLRLKKYSAEDLCKAIDNIRGSPFHCGEDEKSGGQVYATPDFIFRSDEQVDKWLKFKPKEPPKESTPKPGPDDKRREMLTSLYEG